MAKEGLLSRLQYVMCKEIGGQFFLEVICERFLILKVPRIFIESE